jgi:hypothetical protein
MRKKRGKRQEGRRRLRGICFRGLKLGVSFSKPQHCLRGKHARRNRRTEYSRHACNPSYLVGRGMKSVV